MPIGNGLTKPVKPMAGIEFSVQQAGVKYSNRKDFVVIKLARDSQTVGVFTKNKFCAAPVQVAKAHLQQQQPQYLVINTGNANAGTGQQGLQDAKQTCELLAQQLGCRPEQVLPFSTGVIGEYLPMPVLEQAIKQVALFDASYLDAAQGIMTTDTRPKAASVSFQLDGQTLTIAGITKGSGMIKPNMGTMLSFIQTDADLSQIDQQALLQQCVDRSFNRITVDSDTSTNDACVLTATAASNAVITAGNLAVFQQHLLELMQTLAFEMVRDGEGASKFIEVNVSQAYDAATALEVAYSVAHSPLVKTALTAGDANWGRILAAVGKAEVQQLDVDLVDVYLDQVCIVKQGQKHPDYTEEQGAAVFAKEELLIDIRLNNGQACEQVWTCDLSYEYIRINAEYRS